MANGLPSSERFIINIPTTDSKPPNSVPGKPRSNSNKESNKEFNLKLTHVGDGDLGEITNRF